MSEPNQPQPQPQLQPPQSEPPQQPQSEQPKASDATNSASGTYDYSKMTPEMQQYMTVRIRIKKTMRAPQHKPRTLTLLFCFNLFLFYHIQQYYQYCQQYMAAMAAAAATTTSATPSASSTEEGKDSKTESSTTAEATTTNSVSQCEYEEWLKTCEAYNQATTSYAEVQLQEQQLLAQQQQAQQPQQQHQYQSHYTSNDEPKSTKTLWVGGIPPEARQMDIDNLFNKYGDIELIKTNATKACAFVKFKDNASATNAFNNTQWNPTVCGRSVRISWAKSDPAEEDAPVSSTAWVGGVEPEVSEAELRQLFSPYGEILQIKLLREKLCAFINYADPDSVRKAKNALNGYNLGTRALKIGYGKVFFSHSSNRNVLVCLFVCFFMCHIE